MKSIARGRAIALGLVINTAALLLSGCTTPAKLTPERLAALGVKDGAMYWEAEQKLAQEGYHCHITGVKREDFDCTKQAGFFPTCIFRVQFQATDENLVSNLRVAEPACIGTP